MIIILFSRQKTLFYKKIVIFHTYEIKFLQRLHTLLFTNLVSFLLNHSVGYFKTLKYRRIQTVKWQADKCIVNWEKFPNKQLWSKILFVWMKHTHTIAGVSTEMQTEHSRIQVQVVTRVLTSSRLLLKRDSSSNDNFVYLLTALHFTFSLQLGSPMYVKHSERICTPLE